MSRLRTLSTNALLVFGGLIVAAGLVEVGFRAGVLPSVDLSGGEQGTEEGIYRADSRGLYTLKPGLTTEWKSPELSGTVTIDAHGFRNLEPAEPDSVRRAELLVLGDSFVFGWGVGDGETLPAMLSVVLGGSRSPYRVVNAGVPGYGPGRASALLRERLLGRHPAGVILVVTESNDILDDLVFATDPLATASEGLTGFWGNFRLLQYLHWKTASLTRWMRMARGENVARTLAYIDECGRLCGERETPFVVALFPSKAQMTATGMTARVLGWIDVETRIHGRLWEHVASHSKIAAAVDLTKVLESAAADEAPLYYPIDGHPTPRAYRECAMALGPVIRRILGGAAK